MINIYEDKISLTSKFSKTKHGCVRVSWSYTIHCHTSQKWSDESVNTNWHLIKIREDHNLHITYSTDQDTKWAASSTAAGITSNHIRNVASSRELNPSSISHKNHSHPQKPFDGTKTLRWANYIGQMTTPWSGWQSTHETNTWVAGQTVVPRQYGFRVTQAAAVAALRFR